MSSPVPVNATAQAETACDRNVRLRMGVDNVFNIKPPFTNIDVDIDRSLGQLPGGGYSLFHDVQGRRFSLGANVRF